MRDDDLREAAPQPADDDAIEAALRGDDTAPPRASLTEDILYLVEDGKTYAEAELNFQKSRISFVAHRSKSPALYVTFAHGFVHLALRSEERRVGKAWFRTGRSGRAADTKQKKKT